METDATKKTMLALGQRVSEIRMQKRWCQEGLAFAAGISKVQLSHIENGTANIRWVTLMKILEAFNMNLGEFVVPSILADYPPKREEIRLKF